MVWAIFPQSVFFSFHFTKSPPSGYAINISWSLSAVSVPSQMAKFVGFTPRQVGILFFSPYDNKVLLFLQMLIWREDQSTVLKKAEKASPITTLPDQSTVLKIATSHPIHLFFPRECKQTSIQINSWRAKIEWNAHKGGIWPNGSISLFQGDGPSNR